MKKIIITLITLLSIFGIASNALALDANGNGQWISIGVPNYMHMGTDGAFYLNGTNQGRCNGAEPRYFRVDMKAPHFKEFYSWVLMASTKDLSMDCVVVSGCGGSEVWIKYCRSAL